MLAVLAFVVLASIAAVGAAPVDAAAEVPFRVRDFQLRDLRADQLPWTSESPMKLPAHKPRDRFGVPLFRWHDGKTYYRPGALAISGMKRIDAYLEKGDERQLEQALKQARRLRRMSLDRRDADWLPFWFDYAPAAQRAPWVNAMSQGLALSFYVRLWEVTGDDTHIDAAKRVFRSFNRFRGKDKGFWVSYTDSRDYLWLEHYPRRNPDLVLNAHLHAVIGLYEYWRATGSELSRTYLLGSITTIRDNLPRYRQPGRYSLYGLRSRTQIKKYHQIHIWQIKVVAAITGDRWFRRFARKLAADRKPRGYVPGLPSAHLPAGIVAIDRDGTRHRAD